MGSPSSRLKTQEQFRPWIDSGLEYVFSPGHAEQAKQVEVQPQQQPAQQQAAPVQQAPARPQPSQKQPPQPPQTQAAPSQPCAPQPEQVASPQSRQSQPAPNTSPGGGAAFPAPWDSFLARVKAKAPKVVCTYMELGLDLGGQPDRRRADVLRNTLTHHLKWPAGTAAFWPVAALVNGALQPNPTMFWKGWELWRSPYIVCFGEEALRLIHPQAEPGATTYLLDHASIFVVPPLAQLTTMLPHEQQIAIEGLFNIRI